MLVKRVKDLNKSDIKDISQDFTSADISVYSGQAAFFLILSFFPFLMFFFSLLNLTPLTEQEFMDWVMTIVPSSFHETLEYFTGEIYEGISGGKITATVVVAVFMSSKAFVSLERGMNAMYHVKETRNMVKRYLYSMLYSIVFAFLLLSLLAIMVFGKRLLAQLFQLLPFLEEVVHFRMIICIPILFGFFLLLFVVLPNRKQRVKQQIPGAALATAGWLIFSGLFSVYVDKYTRYSSFYGTMTTIALIMVWLYGCMYVLFVGGFINREIEKKGLFY